MDGHYTLKHGSIKENEDVIIYEIPKAQTDLVETEQLDELKRKDSFFFEFQRYMVDAKFVRIYYKKPQGYTALKKIPQMDVELKQKIASNILSVEKLIGTQYTTLVHPDNIYVNDSGDVKFAHRGIRSVLPTEELTSTQLLEELKPILFHLFTSTDFSEITNINEKLAKSDPFIKKLHEASTINQLRKILNTNQIQTKTPVKPNVAMAKKEKSRLKISLATGFLIGIVMGMILLYTIKVVPLTQASTTTADQQKEKHEVLSSKNKELQSLLDDNRSVMHAYRSAVIGDTEEAISIFESVEELDESAERTLIEQYIKLNTLESLMKAAEMSEAYHVRVVEGLAALNSSEAQQAILNIQSETPEVKTEQAWINKEYKNVIELYKGIADNNRAKLLAAKSYIELGNHKEAMKLGKELENKDVQIASIELQKKKVNDNKDMDKDKKKDEIKKLDEQIKKIKG